MSISRRFRGYLPVVVDVETGGFNPKTDALLEAAAVIVDMDDSGQLFPYEAVHVQVAAFEGANIEKEALKVNGIQPDNPLRGALSEKEALSVLFEPIRAAVKATGCKRAILVGHNAAFDLNFILAAVARTKHKRCPFHPFSTFDTVTLAGMAYGETVLAKASHAAEIEFDYTQAHGALYDTEKTAELFCKIINTVHISQAFLVGQSA